MNLGYSTDYNFLITLGYDGNLFDVPPGDFNIEPQQQNWMINPTIKH